MSGGARECLVFRVPMRHPGDTSAVTGLIERGEIRADEIVAIFGKTEGNGCVNDFTRAYAVSALKARWHRPSAASRTMSGIGSRW
jgi:cyanuric acid amidohydrolase